MAESNADERLERFKADVAALRVGLPDPAGDVRKLRAGGGLLVLGVAVGIVALLISHDTSDPLVQRDAMVLALVGVSTSIAGAALYVRHGLTHFLRFWLARTVYERSLPLPAEVPTSAPSRNGGASPSAHGATPVEH
jgi:hypothetical protein